METACNLVLNSKISDALYVLNYDPTITRVYYQDEIIFESFFGRYRKVCIERCIGNQPFSHFRLYVKLAIHHTLVEHESEYLNQLFEREVYIHNYVLPEIDRFSVNVDRLKLLREYHLAYGSCYMEQKNEFIVYSESIERYSYRNIFDFQHCRLMMKFLAKFHALSYLVGRYTYYNPPSTITGYRVWEIYGNFFSSQKLLDVYNTYMQLGIQHVLDLPNAQQYVHLINNFWGQFSQDMEGMMQRALSEHICVVVHGNLNPKTIKFRYNIFGDPIGVMLTEWQMAHVNSAAVDVAMFLSVCVDAELRQLRGDELIAIYERERRLTLLALGASLEGANLYFNLPQEARYFYKYGVSLSCVSLFYTPFEEYIRPEFKQKIAQSFIYAIDRGYFDYND